MGKQIDSGAIVKVGEKSLSLRFSFAVHFDSPETAKAYGVALGFALDAPPERCRG